MRKQQKKRRSRRKRVVVVDSTTTTRKRGSVTDADLEALGLERQVTTRHLCAITGFTRAGIKKLRDNGTLPPAKRIGQTVAWPVSVIRDWLASRPVA